MDLATNHIDIHRKVTEDWKVAVMDTGLYATTGQRVSRAKKYVDEDMFLITDGDCLSNINICDLVAFAKKNDRLITIAVACPTGRNYVVGVGKGDILETMNPARGGNVNAWINACTYVFQRDVFRFLKGNYELDKQLLPELAERKQIAVYRHYGFWCPVETMRDKVDLENRWNAGIALWKVWME